MKNKKTKTKQNVLVLPPFWIFFEINIGKIWFKNEKKHLFRNSKHVKFQNSKKGYSNFKK